MTKPMGQMVKRVFMMSDAVVYVRAENIKDIEAAAPESPGLNHPPLQVSMDVIWFRVANNLFRGLPWCSKGSREASDRGRVPSH